MLFLLGETNNLQIFTFYVVQHEVTSVCVQSIQIKFNDEKTPEEMELVISKNTWTLNTDNYKAN